MTDGSATPAMSWSVARPPCASCPGLRITKIAVGPYDNNAYLLRCTATGDTMLIDAAAEPDRLLAARGDGMLVSVVTTHQHPDHWQALEAVVGVTGPAVIAHPLDAPGLPIPMTETVVDGDVLEVGDAPAARHSPARSHAGKHRVAVRRRSVCAAYLHWRLVVSRRPWQHAEERRRLHLVDERPRSAGVRRACRMRPGCIRVTAPTRRSAPSARI